MIANGFAKMGHLATSHWASQARQTQCSIFAESRWAGLATKAVPKEQWSFESALALFFES